MDKPQQIYGKNSNKNWELTPFAGFFGSEGKHGRKKFLNTGVFSSKYLQGRFVDIAKKTLCLLVFLSLAVIKFKFLLTTEWTYPCSSLIAQWTYLLFRCRGAKRLYFFILSTRFADHHHTCRARTVMFLTYVHGTKVHIFSLAPPKTTLLFYVTHWFSFCAMWWRRKVMKSGATDSYPYTCSFVTILYIWGLLYNPLKLGLWVSFSV